MDRTIAGSLADSAEICQVPALGRFATGAIRHLEVVVGTAVSVSGIIVVREELSRRSARHFLSVYIRSLTRQQQLALAGSSKGRPTRIDTRNGGTERTLARFSVWWDQIWVVYLEKRKRQQQAKQHYRAKTTEPLTMIWDTEVPAYGDTQAGGGVWGGGEYEPVN